MFDYKIKWVFIGQIELELIFYRCSNLKEDIMMKRVLSIGSLMTIGIGASVAMWLSNKPNRSKAKNFPGEWKRKVKPTIFGKSGKFPIEKGGNSHPHDIEDNNMVSEGAMYSVKFYNEKIQ